MELTPTLLSVSDLWNCFPDVDHENGGVELIFEEEDSSLYEDAPPTTPAPTLNKATPGLTPSRATPKRVAVTAKPRTPLSAKRVTPLRTRQRTLSAKSTPKVQSPKVPTPHTRSRSVSNTPKTPADEPPENDKENVGKQKLWNMRFCDPAIQFNLTNWPLKLIDSWKKLAEILDYIVSCILLTEKWLRF